MKRLRSAVATVSPINRYGVVETEIETNQTLELSFAITRKLITPAPEIRIFPQGSSGNITVVRKPEIGTETNTHLLL